MLFDLVEASFAFFGNNHIHFLCASEFPAQKLYV